MPNTKLIGEIEDRGARPAALYVGPAKSASDLSPARRERLVMP